MQFCKLASTVKMRFQELEYISCPHIYYVCITSSTLLGVSYFTRKRQEWSKRLLVYYIYLEISSGGPLIHAKSDTDDSAVVIGIASFVSGSGCGHPNYPSVYAYVTPFLDWIKSKME